MANQPLQKTVGQPVSKPLNNKPSRARYLILFLLFIGTAINYLDRTNISVAAPFIKADLHLNPAMLGLIFSAFGWSYAFMQIPGGWFLDRFGPRLAYGASLILWSLFTLFQGFAKNFGLLFGLRVGLGLSEAPAFPTNSRVVAAWFPQQERAFATGVYTAGEYIGLAFLTPFLFWILDQFGWSTIFFVTGLIGLVWSIMWFKLYRDPKESKRVNQLEMDYIREGGGLAEKAGEKIKLNWSHLGHLFKFRQFWGIYIGQFAIASTLYFFLTWFPSYLVTAKHMTMLKAGFVASVPYIAAFIGVLFGGFWSDRMVKSGRSTGAARKIPIITGLSLACLIILANYTSSTSLVILIMSVAFFGQGMSAIGWTLVSDIAPRELVGLAGGVFNFAANLSGIITPIIIGLIVNSTNSFNGAIWFVGAVALLGVVAYTFIVGEVRRIELNSNQ
ncbi:ACS family D-galactonate transporter-like MFS transporter [Neobacillus ginsengisoli]|uniref:ACS family D-galactonate transporter-like MFS transporter n=1 Tax=Neobacillus ginsengisoli TaxID=904295 RepID=A0ABT9Y029_9BACI|nr:MFS transporter [Neobacillus ginsengisoli]MDQ0201183.1 ACS family D-galactonate transporter-like MFS transporter [Neobacillus ginsengisoli]